MIEVNQDYHKTTLKKAINIPLLAKHENNCSLVDNEELGKAHLICRDWKNRFNLAFIQDSMELLQINSDFR